MKKSIVLAAALLCLGFSSNSVFAQTEEIKQDKDESPNFKNALKIAPFSLLTGRVRIGYERAIGAKTSINLGVGGFYLPLSNIAFSSTNVSNLSADGGTASQFSVRPELRFYTGSKGIQKGFYIGPYMNYGRIGLDIVSEVNDPDFPTSRAEIKGSYSSIGGGFSLGNKFRLGKRAFIDWTILSLGVNMSQLGMTLKGEGWDSGDYQQFKDDILIAVADYPFISTKLEAIEGANQLRIQAPLILPAFRSTLTFGIAF